MAAPLPVSVTIYCAGCIAAATCMYCTRSGYSDWLSLASQDFIFQNTSYVASAHMAVVQEESHKLKLKLSRTATQNVTENDITPVLFFWWPGWPHTHTVWSSDFLRVPYLFSSWQADMKFFKHLILQFEKLSIFFRGFDQDLYFTCSHSKKVIHYFWNWTKHETNY